MPLFLRKVSKTDIAYEAVETQSSSAVYVERDKIGKVVAVMPVESTKEEIEPWRAATPIEAAIFKRGDGYSTN